MNSKSILVNPMVINIIYPSLKVRVKVVSVKMKYGTINVVFLVIFLAYFPSLLLFIEKYPRIALQKFISQI